MAIGYYDHPVMIQVPGEDLPHVRHYYATAPALRPAVVIVGGGNSAAESALEMFRAGALYARHRGPTLKSTIKYWVRPDIENRIKEGRCARFGHC